MSLLVVASVAIALSADNFALALAVGAAHAGRRDFASVFRLPVIFGVCQFAAPVAGWLLGWQAASSLRGYSGFVAFAALAIVGWRMLRSAWSVSGDPLPVASSWPAAIALGLATSVDSLAVGFGLAMTDANIVVAAGLIGAITAALSLAGMLLGRRLGGGLGVQSRVVAGIVLLVLGVRMLLTQR